MQSLFVRCASRDLSLGMIIRNDKTDFNWHVNFVGISPAAVSTPILHTS